MNRIRSCLIISVGRSIALVVVVTRYRDIVVVVISSTGTEISACPGGPKRRFIFSAERIIAENGIDIFTFKSTGSMCGIEMIVSGVLIVGRRDGTSGLFVWFVRTIPRREIIGRRVGRSVIGCAISKGRWLQEGILQFICKHKKYYVLLKAN